MGKNNNFQNPAARKFGNIETVDQFSEDEIYRLLVDEMPVILRQINAAKSGGKYPEYAVNMFANVSSAKFVLEYAQTWNKQVRKTGDSDLMDISDVKALRQLIADGYIRRDKFVAQKFDEKDRNKYLLKAYALLDPVGVKIAKKLKLKKKATIEVALLVRKPAKYSVDRLGKLFDMSTVSNKKKLKVLKKLTHTKKRFVDYIGSALTINRAITDFVGMAYDVVMPRKEVKKGKLTKKIRKRRAPYLRAYATTFKKRKQFNTILTDDFYKLNKKLIKELIREDAGFKKAFAILKAKKVVVTTKKSQKGSKSVNTAALEKSANAGKSMKVRKPVPRNADLTKFLDAIHDSGGLA